MFHKMVGHLMTVGTETCSAETRFPLCRDKVIKQHRSQLYPDLTKMSRSEALRPASPGSSMISMTKPNSDMYTHHHFTELEQEHSNFVQDQPSPKVVDRYTLCSFTDPGCKQKSNVPERVVWMVQHNGPFPLENQTISPTQMFHNEQLRWCKRHSERHQTSFTIYR